MWLTTSLGCQCFVPVDEGFDAGVRDAGLVLDGGVPCRRSSDCPRPAAAPPFCGDAAPSCVNARCLLECPGSGGRTCSQSAVLCLDCDAGQPLCAGCRPQACAFTLDPVQSRCPPPFDSQARFTMEPFSGRCGGGIVFDGGLLGVWLGALEGDTTMIDLPPLGGICLGSRLATGAPRTLVSCPSCTFVAEGCE